MRQTLILALKVLCFQSFTRKVFGGYQVVETKEIKVLTFDAI